MLSADDGLTVARELVLMGFAARVLVVPDARGDFARVDVVERPGATLGRRGYRSLVEYAEGRDLELRPSSGDGAIVELRGPAGP